MLAYTSSKTLRNTYLKKNLSQGEYLFFVEV
jgi:hypothetical protein